MGQHISSRSVWHVVPILACMQMTVADREQEIMSAAGLNTVGGTGTVGHGAMERALRIVPGGERSPHRLYLLWRSP